jgi:hypothetical protein
VGTEISKEFTMAETTPVEAPQQQEGDEAPSDVFERVSAALDAWRSRIDELVVQLDLASREGRDELRKRIDLAQNVYLAAQSRLSQAQADLRANVSAAKEGLEHLLRDLASAYEEAEAVLRRARQS